MKAKKNLLIGVTLGAMLGWPLGFLRLPYIEKNLSFMVGFISCFVLSALVLILVFVWNKHSILIRLIGKDSTSQNSNKATQTYKLIWILVSAFIVFGGLISSFLIHKQNELFETKTHFQNERIREQSELIVSVRKSNMIILMNDILKKVDDELKNNSTGTLSDNTIASIVEAFNYYFSPYRYLEGDSLSDKKLSPEKGQLLLALYTRKIDSVSFNKIKLQATFSGADLKGTNLSGIDLSGCDLNGADFRNADLSNAILNDADLRNANLWGAHLSKANLAGADMRRSVLSWAELNESKLESANLANADLTNAQLRNADLRKTYFRAAKLNGALLNGADLEGGDLGYASMVKSNLTMTNLTQVEFFGANFNEAIMTDAELVNSEVDKDWFEKLNNWHIVGRNDIQKRYKIVLFKVIQDVHKYRLEKK